MSPDGVDDSVASLGEFGRSNHGHPTKHRRGKTGRSRRKRRYWKYFSRWRTDDSDDDDIELYQWSKSRGLTSRTLPPAPAQPSKPAMPQGRTKASAEPTESRSAIVLRTQRSVETIKRAPSANDINMIQEAIFLTKLCASIMDKKLFVRQSTEINKENDVKKVPEVQDRRNEHKTSLPVTRKMSNRTKSANNSKNASDLESIAEKAKRTASLPLIENSTMRYGDREDSAKVRDCETNDSSKEPLQIKKLSCSRKGSATSSTKSAPLPKKEWSANVESDVLRLYETSASVQPSSLVCSWASPSLLLRNNRNTTSTSSTSSDIAQVIEKKIERAEHTPSYVQVLAKMFKSRMQLRKERERMESEMRKSRQRNASRDTTMSVTENDVQLSSSALNSTVPVLASFAHLRYRHQNDDISTLGAERRNSEKISTAVIHQHHSNSVPLEPSQRRDVTSKSSTKSHDLQIPYLQTQIADGEGAGNTASQDGRVLINATRLDHEARSKSDDLSCSQLNVSGTVSRLCKPPPLPPPANEDSNTPQALIRKARQCLLSNSRLRYGEKERRISPAQPSGGAGVLSRVVATNARHKSEVQVRWPTSVGSLYFRPPAKTYHKEFVQKA